MNTVGARVLTSAFGIVRYSTGNTSGVSAVAHDTFYETGSVLNNDSELIGCQAS